MPTRLDCPKCKASLRILKSYAGKDVRCKMCKTTFTVPGPASAAGAATGAPTGEVVTEVEPQRPARARWVAAALALPLVGGLGFASVRAFLPGKPAVTEPARPAIVAKPMPAPTSSQPRPTSPVMPAKLEVPADSLKAPGQLVPASGTEPAGTSSAGRP
jgi:predicted Zn finger-like uncharacterized protein